MHNSTMLGTYTLDGDVPVEPEIVLANCTDTAMVTRLVSAFRGSPDIRFFMLENVDEDIVDLNADFHFLKDNGNWVLANHNTLLDVLFDDAGFNPGGNETTFTLAEDGSWAVDAENETTDAAGMPHDADFLLDMGEHDLFVNHDTPNTDAEPATFYVDPSLLPAGEHEILVSDFTLGHDILELPADMAVKDVIVDAEHDLTRLILDGGESDIVVSLMGVLQADLPDHDFAMTADSGDDLISHMIHSGMHRE